MSKPSGMEIAGSESAGKDLTSCLSETEMGEVGVTSLGVTSLLAPAFGRILVLERVLKDEKSV
jgi:hypothetical protein